MEKQIVRFLERLDGDRGFSNNTISAYRNDLKQFLTFMKNERGVESWLELNEGQLTNYVLHLRDREYARSTVARKVAAVKSFCHFLVSDGILRADPTDNLASPRVDKFVPRAISQEEIQLLLKKPEESRTPEALRDKAMLETLYSTGMRVSELTALDLGDVDLARSEIVCGKRPDRERRVPLNDDSINAISRYLAEGRPNLRLSSDMPALFLNHRGSRLTRQGFWLILKAYADAAGIGDITPHTIRHSFAVHKLANGSELRDIQRIMGHMSLATTQVYRQVVSEDGTPETIEEVPEPAVVAKAEVGSNSDIDGED